MHAVWMYVYKQWTCTLTPRGERSARRARWGYWFVGYDVTELSLDPFSFETFLLVDDKCTRQGTPKCSAETAYVCRWQDPFISLHPFFKDFFPLFSFSFDFDCCHWIPKIGGITTSLGPITHSPSPWPGWVTLSENFAPKLYCVLSSSQKLRPDNEKK